MRLLSTAVLCILLFAFQHISRCQGLTYTITVRDFLPSSCSLLLGNVAAGENYTIITNIAGQCPYQDDIKAGTISGHPDFERRDNAASIPRSFYTEHKIVGSNGYLKPNSNGIGASAGRDDVETIVQEYAEIAESGLAKPSYCASNSGSGPNGEVRCGAFKQGIETRYGTVSECYLIS